MEIKVEYKDNDGFYIIKLSDNEYYYGDGSTFDSIGISANQFLRFHPYMDYVGNKDIKPPDNVIKAVEMIRRKGEQHGLQARPDRMHELHQKVPDLRRCASCGLYSGETYAGN